MEFVLELMACMLRDPTIVPIYDAVVEAFTS